MSAFGWKRVTFPAILLAAVVAVGLYFPTIHGQGVKPTPASGSGVDEIALSAVVDIERLVEAHPDAAKLKALDNEIALVAGRIDPGDMGGRDRVIEDMYRQFSTMQKRLIGEFEMLVAQIRAQMSTHKAAVETQLKAEAARLKIEMEAYQRQVMPESSRSQAPSIPQARRKEVQTRLASYLGDLQLVRDRNLAARRLALQKQVEQNMAEQKRQLEEQLNKKVEAVQREHQHEKLQLQLDMQTASDEEQRKKLQDRLDAMTRQEEAKRDAYRAEQSKTYEAARAAEMKKAQQQLKVYADKLNGDVRRQIEGEQRRLLVYTLPPGTSAHVSGSTNDIKAKLEAKQRELKGRFEARKNQLMSGLQAESQAAQSRLRAKQKEIQVRLNSEKQKILKFGRKQQDVWTTEEKKRRERLQRELEALKTQRERVYNQIVDQIREGVALLAREEKVPFVFSGYRVNVGCKDLTETVLHKVLKK